ncbi:hypothetical protein BDV37DRAFT_167709 [Aspergillus pseudonomiae]|uniref:Amino acid permease/ SLC12A domain-containing protein n=1 Tax=Aspergillus pseudonomiae TaxID=1506151 RepID=A0A5N7D692_9EURO|nr:uncharacterized protein BDV37DRAFT_167709 [Aspergillus pseudonomiae]KAE8401916.1 hypothetical protein BDV37DRAFT_167709 [Aspergillus pseudonomiae]
MVTALGLILDVLYYVLSIYEGTGHTRSGWTFRVDSLYSPPLLVASAVLAPINRTRNKLLLHFGRVKQTRKGRCDLGIPTYRCQ